MVLDFSIPGMVEIAMKEYVQEIIKPGDMSGTAPMPAGNHLFSISTTSASYLNDLDAQHFHHIVAKLLFLCKRSRPEIQTTVAFITTRVKGPDLDDYKKLSCVIKYVRGTQNISLKLCANCTDEISWWVDASFSTHHDMRSHTGMVMMLGSGARYSTSIRLKIFIKSSTEAEIVGVNDTMGKVLWTHAFLEEQGHKVSRNIIFQDNKSAILLAENGRGSASKRTRHMDIRYFFK